MESLKTLIKCLLPPIFVDLIRNRSNGFGWVGDYKTWEDAQKDSSGYDSDIIFEKVKASLLKVKNGEAAYERDSVLFNEIQYSWPLLSAMMWIAAQNKGCLRIIDYGGSLGSTYFQNRQFLKDLKQVKWDIVEQPKFVEYGKTLFEDEILKFYPNIESCLITNDPDVVLLSSVLQYLEKPGELLKKLLKTSVKFVIIDRTPFFKHLDTDIIKLQRVNPEVYPASYPCRIFGKDFLDRELGKSYRVISYFDSQCDPILKTNGDIIMFKGCILRTDA